MADKIGIRAIREIKARAFAEDKTIKQTLEPIRISKQVLHSWKMGKNAPGGKMLRSMALNGYDIYYILTGERKNDG